MRLGDKPLYNTSIYIKIIKIFNVKNTVKKHPHFKSKTLSTMKIII
jgi:hypothetical protein